ncbi:hypothetical protein LOAG_11451 [Loa loa]|uniref:Uncharacterized protein n=1 Tax=Loa loa TaxID=7209 RepID=A0A1S0TN34_LOALO|nr:hypothetical protein LOAG_11451 [Loa loa]EFO17052.1 hypothetical protein LOAG_11451 [Loa loa]
MIAADGRAVWNGHRSTKLDHCITTNIFCGKAFFSIQHSTEINGVRAPMILSMVPILTHVVFPQCLTETILTIKLRLKDAAISFHSLCITQAICGVDNRFLLRILSTIF